MKYICTSLGMVFSYLSPMVHKRLACSEKRIKVQLRFQNQMFIDEIKKKLPTIHSSHFIPLKWSLHVLDEAQEKGEVDNKYLISFITEINAIHSKCDRLVSFRHENFSRALTSCATISVFSYFIAGLVSFCI